MVWASDHQVQESFQALAEAVESGLGVPALVADPRASASIHPAVREAVAAATRSGSTLTAALARSGVLGQTELALVRAGEQSGRLGESFRQVSTGRARRRKGRWKLAAVLAYPGLLLSAAGCILPLPRVLDGLGAYLVLAVPTPLLVLLAAVAVLVGLPWTSPDALSTRLVGRLAFGLPVIGVPLRRGAHAAFAEVLGASLAAGLTAPMSLQSAALASGDLALVDALPPALERIATGGTLTDAVETLGRLRPAFLTRVAQAEATGTLDTALPGLAEEERAIARRWVVALLAATVAVAFALVTALMLAGIVAGFESYLNQLDGLRDLK